MTLSGEWRCDVRDERERSWGGGGGGGGGGRERGIHQPFTNDTTTTQYMTIHYQTHDHYGYNT